MEKIVLIPDSFKGSMRSSEICAISERAILAHWPQCAVISLPMADGGEGTVEALLAAKGGKRVTKKVSGPYFRPQEASYAIIEGRAVIEVAACAGLPLVGHDKRPGETTTYGVGELILDAALKGCKEIVVGLGGSATVDGGVGLAAAVGISFLNADGETFIPTGNTLKKIARVDYSRKSPLLKDVKLTAISDVDNPLLGPRGAARVFGPQKGADSAMVEFLEDQLTHLSGLYTTRGVVNLPGAGAAGGLGGGLVAFLGATLVSGIDYILTIIDFEGLIAGADLIITGEGRLDGQSLGGKVVSGVAKRAKAQKIPVVAIVGDIGEGSTQFYKEGVVGIFSINRVAVPLEEALKRSQEDLYFTVDNLIRFLSSVR
ncbi:MAG: glycerate kinase [Sphaerochaetaceae bacterium]